MLGKKNKMEAKNDAIKKIRSDIILNNHNAFYERVMAELEKKNYFNKNNKEKEHLK